MADLSLVAAARLALHLGFEGELSLEFHSPLPNLHGNLVRGRASLLLAALL